MPKEKVEYEIEFDTKGAVLGIKKVEKGLDGIDKKAGKASKSLDGMLDFLKPSPLAIAAAGVTAVGAGMAFATRKTMEFEKAMSGARSVLGDVSDKDFEKLRAAALEAGSTTSFTAAQAAKGLEFLGMAGFTATQAVTALPGVLDLAAASGIELGRSADIASNILSQFQKPASQTNQVVDLLAKTVTSSNQNMEQLADAMNYLGPTAAALKIPIEETAAVTGIMANNGLQGSLGTRALGTSMVRLSKPTKAMKEVMKDLNLEFFDQQGQFKGIIGLTEELERGTAGMTDKQKQATLATLFGAEAIQEMNILLSKGSKGIAEFTEKLSDSEGAAGKMAEIRLDNLAGDITKLQSATEGLAITIGQEADGSMRNLVQDTTSFIQLLTENKDSIIEWFSPFVEVKDSVSELFTTINSFFDSTEEKISAMSVVFEVLKEGIKQSLVPFKTLIDFTNGFLKAIKEVIDAIPEIGEGFKSNWRDIKSLGGLLGEDEPKVTEPEKVLTDEELGFVPVEKKKEQPKPEEEPIVLSPKTLQNQAAMDAIATAGKTNKIDSTVDRVSGPKTTNITLSINKLVENINVETQTLPESMGQIRDIVVETLLTAANDVNLIAE